MNVSRQLLLNSMLEGRESYSVRTQGTHTRFSCVRHCRKAPFAEIYSRGTQHSRGAVNFERDTVFSAFMPPPSPTSSGSSWFSFERLNPPKRNTYNLDQCNYAFHSPKPKMDGCGIFKRDLALISPVTKQGTYTGPYWRKWDGEKETFKALRLPATKSHQPKQWPYLSPNKHLGPF